MSREHNNQLVIGLPSLEGQKSVLSFEGGSLWIEARVFRGGNIPLMPNIESFLPIVLLIGSQRGCDVRVTANIDDAYFAGLNLGFCPFISDFYGSYKIKLERSGSSETVGVSTAGKSALLFSGGVDSFYSLKKLLDLGITPDYLLNIHAGAHDDNRETWNVRLQNIARVADKLKIPIIELDTNFHVLYPNDHVRCATIRNMAACLSLNPRVSTFYYSSAISFSDISFTVAKEHGIHFIDHAAICDLLPPSVRAVEIGYDATRSQKTLAVAEFELSHEILDVCTDQPYQAARERTQPLNCGRCAKCLRTIATLEHHRRLDDFSSVFALETWKTSKRQALEYLRSSHEPLDQDVLEFFKDDRAQDFSDR